MTQFIEIHWSTGNIDEARRVCRYLAQERHAACCQILPWIESICMWNNQLETTQESLVIIKTRLEKYDMIKEIIEQNTTYEVPEIIYTYVDGGNPDYLKWMEETVPALDAAK